MTESLISALIQDIVSLLKKEKGFLGLNEDQRKAKAPAIAAALAGMSEAQFIDDLAVTMKVLKGSEMAQQSQLIKSLTQYFIVDFSAVFDQLDRDFYRLKEAEQVKKLKELLPEQSQFFSELRRQLLIMSPQEMTQSITDLLREVHNSPLILVQSPSECDRDTKTAIRQHFAGKYSNSFVAFTVNPQLIGGIRFFVDGQVDDHSWFAKIQQIRNLSTLV